MIWIFAGALVIEAGAMLGCLLRMQKMLHSLTARLEEAARAELEAQAAWTAEFTKRQQQMDNLMRYTGEPGGKDGTYA